MSPAAPAASRPDLEVEEVRIAMALNGGVSLAVWMGGCAVEIDCARRADLGPEELEGTPTRRVYAAICEALGRRLVVDVMSGASAGGINGALLAAAGVARRRLHPGYLRSRWIELGDLGALLQPLSNADPRSLMDGDYFHQQLRRTFEEVLWPDRERPDPEPRNQPPHEPPALVPPPALDVTTTNVAGEDRRFRDAWGDELTALEYRARFSFRSEADYAAGALAVAARSSASFPLAFEPWKVEDPAALALAGFAEPRSVIDGGLLDNAPIAAAIDLINARRTNRLVKRYLCYVNGEPKDVTVRPSDPDFAPRLPAVLANVLGLPRKAPFADQLRALDDVSWRGAPTLEAELSLLALDAAALEQTAAALLGIYRDRRRLVSLREVLVQPDLARRAWARVADPSHPLELPWVPLSIEPPSVGRWGWGVQAARRVHHLMLDMLRASMPQAQPGGVEALLAARMEIDERVAASEQRRSAVGGDETVRALLAELAEDAEPEP
ncbi:MAG: patatin-like phospholipase family protein, partial [Solirubrobacteraceae bacterium]